MINKLYKRINLAKPGLFLALLFTSITASITAQADPTPKVVTSIAPVYQLTADIMAGVGQPTLLVDGFNSPHDYSIRPSDARALAAADLILWIGKDMEQFLQRQLKNYRDTTNIITLINSQGLTLLPVVHDALAITPNHHHGHQHINSAKDTHIWLDPNNAIIMSKRISKALSEIDPEHAVRYQENTEQLISAIKQFVENAQKRLGSVTKQPFLVYHDAYQYLTHYFVLNNVGYVALNSGRQPSAKQIRQIRELIEKQQVHCIFTEPQFRAPVIRTLTENFQMRIHTLDPLGVQHTQEPYGYIKTMETNVNEILACLKQD